MAHHFVKSVLKKLQKNPIREVVNVFDNKETNEFVECNCEASIYHTCYITPLEKFSEIDFPAEENFRSIVLSWVTEAKSMGLKKDFNILKYLESCVKNRSDYHPIEQRLVSYLNFYHKDLLVDIEVTDFATKATAFAQKHNIYQDEGITWLSVILLACKKALY